MSMDMGNTFCFISGPFCGHVVERDCLCGATAEVCEVGFEGPTKHVAIVPSLRNQSQDRVPMEGALRRRRSFGSAGSKLSPPPLAQANLLGLGEPDSTDATAASKLGQPKIGGSVAPG